MNYNIVISQWFYLVHTCLVTFHLVIFICLNISHIYMNNTKSQKEYNLYINTIYITLLIYLFVMDFTPEWKLVRAACLLNEFLNENHRNFYKNFRSVQSEMNDQNKKDTNVKNKIENEELYETTFPPLIKPEFTPHSKFNKSYFKNRWSKIVENDLTDDVVN